SDADIMKAFYSTEEIKVAPANKERLLGATAVGDVIDPDTGEVFADSGMVLTAEQVDKIFASTLREVTALAKVRDPLILASLDEDPTSTHEEALLKIYQRLRPGNPPQLEKARELFKEKFQDPNRYRLGKVGRFRINRKFDQNIDESEMTLNALDYLNAIRYILK